MNSTDGRETVPFFDPRDERFLEYTLTRLVYNLDNPEKKQVAVLSSLPVDGGQPLPGQRPPQPGGLVLCWQNHGNAHPPSLATQGR